MTPRTKFSDFLNENTQSDYRTNTAKSIKDLKDEASSLFFSLWEQGWGDVDTEDKDEKRLISQIENTMDEGQKHLKLALKEMETAYKKYLEFDKLKKRYFDEYE